MIKSGEKKEEYREIKPYYTSRFNFEDEIKNGKLLNCFPCPSCRKALLDRGIKNIFYTNENGYNYERWYDNE